MRIEFRLGKSSQASLGSTAAILMCLSILSGGCGMTNVQKEGVATFGKAAGTLGSASGEHLQAFRDDVIRMKMARLAIEGQKLPVAPQDGKITPRDFYTKELNLDAGLDPDNLEKRLQATELLTSYGKLLQTLTKKTQEKELSEAADKFTGSIKKFPGVSMSDEQLGGLGRLVTMAGNWWIEREKEKVVRQIVPTVSPLIQKLCDDLKRDFDIHGGGFASQVDGTQDRLAREAIDGLKRETSGIADRLVLVEGFAHANDSKETLEKVSAHVLKAIEGMRAADKNLVDLMNDRKVTFEEIRSYSKDASELATALKPFAVH